MKNIGATTGAHRPQVKARKAMPKKVTRLMIHSRGTSLTESLHKQSMSVLKVATYSLF